MSEIEVIESSYADAMSETAYRTKIPFVKDEEKSRLASGLIRIIDAATTSSTDSRDTTSTRLRSVATFKKSNIRQKVEVELVGAVTKVTEDSFTAELVDNLVSTNPKQVARFSFDDVQPEDLSHVHVGAVFNLYVGKITERDGMKVRERYSKLVFRRFPEFTKREVQIASDKASEFLKRLAN